MCNVKKIFSLLNMLCVSDTLDQSFQDQVRKITEITNKSINLLFLLNISINIHYLCMDGPRGLMFPFYNVF